MSGALCPACGERSALPWRAAHEVVSGQAAAAHLLRRCGSCGTASLAEPGPAAVTSELYETGAYAPQGGLRNRLLGPARALTDCELVHLIGLRSPSERVIEVGSGRGRLVAALRARGHDAVGIEPSRVSAAASAERGLPVEAVTLEEASFPAGEADRVVLWHVLEHLTEPSDALARIGGWVKPGGSVVIAVPNLDSLQARIGGDRWFHQDVPRHRTHFTPRGLSALLRRCALRPVSAHHVMVEQNWLGMWLTLLNLLTSGRDVPFRFLKRDLTYTRRRDAVRDALLSVIAGIPLIPVAVIAELTAGLRRRGGTIVVEAAAA